MFRVIIAVWRCSGSVYWCCLLQSRLEALNQMQQLLSTPRHCSNKMPPSSGSDLSTAMTLLSSAHHQLLVGCFGFGLVDGTDHIIDGQLCHYQVMLITIIVIVFSMFCMA